MPPLLSSLLYWSVLVLVVPGALAFAIWILAAIRLRKPLQIVNAVLLAAAFGGCVLGVRSVHQDHLHHRHASQHSLAFGKWILALGVSGTVLFLIMPRRQRWALDNTVKGPEDNP